MMRFEPVRNALVVWREERPYSDDVYFSKDDGLSEAMFVFIEGNRLIERWQTLDPKGSFVIAETAFGSGLLFLLTWFLWKKSAKPSMRLHYISSVKHPLSRNDLARCIGLWPELIEEASSLLAIYPTLISGHHLLSFDDGRVHLTLIIEEPLTAFDDLLLCRDAPTETKIRTYHVDAWFLNGCVPTTTTDLLNDKLLVTMAMLSKKGTTLATYFVESPIKNCLSNAGFEVIIESEEGSRHRHLQAELTTLPSKYMQRFTPWHVSSSKKPKNQKALVIGGGLAGSFIANSLASRGWSMTLLDANNEIACGASGVSEAILYPKLTVFRSPLTRFMQSTYLFASRLYPQLLSNAAFGELSGILQLAYDQKEQENHKQLKDWLSNYPELGRLIPASEASELAGISVTSDALFIPGSGWIDSSALCRHLIDTSTITWVPNTEIGTLKYIDGLWHANDHQAEVLIIANGFKASQFDQTAHLPLKSIRGQMTSISSNNRSHHLKIPLCANGHILPQRGGVHSLGATYASGLSDDRCTQADDETNLSKLATFSNKMRWSSTIVSHWAGIRAATPDYLPLVGPVANAKVFKEKLKGLSSNPKRWLVAEELYHPGLYIMAGFGSRGLTTIPLSAEYLAATINHEPNGLPRSLCEAIAPARFLRREMIRGQKELPLS